MKSQRNISETEKRTDTDLLAIKKVMEDSADTAPPVQMEHSIKDTTDVTNHAKVPRGQAALPPLAQVTEAAEPLPDRSLKRVLGAGCRALFERARTYRPERKRILWTSLVLMLLLQPFFVIGWSLFCVGLVVALYLVWGGDVFWRRLIALYQRAERRWPEPARRLKLRAYVMGKKWNRLLAWTPDRIADQLRGPDLRQLMAADAQHDAVMSERLTRL